MNCKGKEKILYKGDDCCEAFSGCFNDNFPNGAF